MNELTPLMAQYRDIKSQYADCILLFRVGDFYETFYDDAIEISSLLNIALTTRDKHKPNPIPLAGVPFHAADTYVGRLLASGKRVAVCDQVEDPATAKGLVRREVVEVLTPGTALSAQLLSDQEDSYCLAVHADGTQAGLALIDVSTGELLCGEAELGDVHHLVQGKRVRELVHAPAVDPAWLEAVRETVGRPWAYALSAEDFMRERAAEALSEQFGGEAPALSACEAVAAGALLRHCMRLRGGRLPQVVGVERFAAARFMAMDGETIANLELFEPLRGGRAEATLVRTIDRTLTPMGGRTIQHWVQKPLCSVAAIDERAEAVERLYADAERHERTLRALKGIADVQRLAARVAARKAAPRELHALRESLEKVPSLRAALAQAGAALLEREAAMLGEHEGLCVRIAAAIVAEPPPHLREGGVIRRGFDADLDELIDESEGAKAWIAGLERREREATGIASLKVGYNKVFGYYIEVSRANMAGVPEHYLQKQTLVSAQRYYTQELKEKEDFILEAEERRVAREQDVFDRLCADVGDAAATIQRTAGAVGRLDAIQSLAATARAHGYRRPIVDDSRAIEIVGGRHAVLERVTADAFVPNDLSLDPERRQFALITGPNMSGKSTFLRQTAIIVLLAQIGSFVPAERARIGWVDQIFTRVGASDRLSRGESTFLVEMNETAYILAHMTDRSLVLLDEIGRGTSTYDGLSIAWAVTEYLLEGERARPRTLFATHFHELTQLRSSYPRLLNLKITIREWEGGIVFLRKIVPGTSDRSFGLHAARVAGVPETVLKRAAEVLESLELRRELIAGGLDAGGRRVQFDLFGAGPPPATREAGDEAARAAVEALSAFDLERATPMAAFDLVRRLKERLS
ncbi:MAG: DNA mismatch repair protein MutS [Candidatus Krumholzibacteria bacterium]|nr:DNA mismatch repair protein MutS [Candidatus Krumholzibacteria bacterium]